MSSMTTPKKDSPQERAVSKYRDGLASLAGMKGRRNASLLGLASLGIMAGLGDERIIAEVKAASGTPPLTEREIGHALRTAHRDTVPLTDRPQSETEWIPPPPKPAPLGTGAKGFVGRMIARGRGASIASLAMSSPLPVPDNPVGQARAFLSVMYANGESLFIGGATDRGMIGATIRTAAEWRGAFDTVPPPPFVIANPLTGSEGMTKDGKPSHRCGACVASYRFALVEFDEMPVEDQAAFWGGVIALGTLPLRSLTHSGGKSIHGLVEIGAKDHAEWARAIDTLLFAVAHPDAPQGHQADRACKNPDRLTRTPGAYRADKGRVQSLLWLSDGSARMLEKVGVQEKVWGAGMMENVEGSEKQDAPQKTGVEAQPLRPTATHSTTTPETADASPEALRNDYAPSKCGRCRDCWNWEPSGIKHGCAAGVMDRPSPDWRGECHRFTAV